MCRTEWSVKFGTERLIVSASFSVVDRKLQTEAVKSPFSESLFHNPDVVMEDGISAMRSTCRAGDENGQCRERDTRHLMARLVQGAPPPAEAEDRLGKFKAFEV